MSNKGKWGDLIGHLTWGESFALRVGKAGGFVSLADKMAAILGPEAPKRSTLDGLKQKDPSTMSDAETFRAYVALLIIGDDPARWGITPPATTPARLLDYVREAVDDIEPYPNAALERRRSAERRQRAARPGSKNRGFRSPDTIRLLLLPRTA